MLVLSLALSKFLMEEITGNDLMGYYAILPKSLGTGSDFFFFFLNLSFTHWCWLDHRTWACPHEGCVICVSPLQFQFYHHLENVCYLLTLEGARRWPHWLEAFWRLYLPCWPSDMIDIQRCQSRMSLLKAYTTGKKKKRERMRERDFWFVSSELIF